MRILPAVVAVVTVLGFAQGLLGCATASAAKDCEVCPICPVSADAGGVSTCPDAPKAARAPTDAPADSVSKDSVRTLKLRALSADSAVAALEVTDDRGGMFLEVRRLRDGEVVKAYRYDAASRRSVWKKAKRKFKLQDQSPKTAHHPTAEALVLTGMDQPGWAVVMVHKAERAVAYLRIPRLRAGETEAGVAFKSLAFSPDGKWIVVVHTQTLMMGGAEVGLDFFYAAAFKAFRLPFGG